MEATLSRRAGIPDRLFNDWRCRRGRNRRGLVGRRTHGAASDAIDDMFGDDYYY